MISQSCLQAFNDRSYRYISSSPPYSVSSIQIRNLRLSSLAFSCFPSLRVSSSGSTSYCCRLAMSSNATVQPQTEGAPSDEEVDVFVEVANKLADAAGEVIRKYFRKGFDIHDKEDFSPVTIADRAAEEAMAAIISETFPAHAIYGEENGWSCKEASAEFVWVLDPIDGTKSFITGKPLFGTLIALLYEGKPIIGIIDQPILKERWIGVSGRKTTLNGHAVSTRLCSKISQAYLYTTSPHLFSGDAEKAFACVRNNHMVGQSKKIEQDFERFHLQQLLLYLSSGSQVKVPLYGCDCYAYGLLASGYVDLVIESGLKPYDFLALIPVIVGAGGLITDWKGQQLQWEASIDACATGFNVVAAGDPVVHQQALNSLQWQ